MAAVSNLAVVVAALACVLFGGRAAAEVLVADLSRHLVAITASFDGTEVLLFGTAAPDAEVVVVVHGPPDSVVVRRKERTLGVWLNRESVRFADVPSFYAVASSAPVGELLDATLRARHGIGVDTLALVAEEGAEAAAFRQGLVRNKQRAGLFPDGEARVRFVGGGLFRTTIRFPANVRPGRYRVEVFSVRDGRVVAAQQSALIITKVGVEARLSEFARRDAELYGLAAVVFAISAGWLAAAAFRRS